MRRQCARRCERKRQHDQRGRMQQRARDESDRGDRSGGGNMQEPLAGSIRVRAHHDHRHRRDEIWHRRHDPDREIAQPAKRSHDLREPETKHVYGKRVTEQKEGAEVSTPCR